MARTPSTKPIQSHGTPSRTPQSKQRIPLTPTLKTILPSTSPVPAGNKEFLPAEHPVEVISRIRDYPDRHRKPVSALQISSDGRSLRIRTDIGYRDFSLDGVSMAEDEDLEGFYKRFVEWRIEGVKLGSKCTIMMYGPTGSGKSHTMFGCSKQPGIVYRALKDILGEGNEETSKLGQSLALGPFVHATVLEIYNEEIYDLLSSNNGTGSNLGWPKGNISKVRLDVMGGKAKNATSISGNEAGKISREIAKVEKRRIVKSTFCNDRSSRSHCVVILDVPSVGGRLMLVDMAGSENIDQAGQVGLEAKMQTAKINQGNIALKRVVESIANGDSYVPFRDSKLTMLLQDSFEDSKSKILMILCANTDPKDMHKTLSTLEYGAKAKCIIRGTNTPAKEKNGMEDSPSLILGSRIAAMDRFIYKLQMENKLKEKECDEAHKELIRKENEVAELRTKLQATEGKELATNEEEINMKVYERTRTLRLELERKVQECQKIANEFVEVGKRRMEEKMLQQQQELEVLRQRLEEIESVFRGPRMDSDVNGNRDSDGCKLIRRISEICSNGEQEMVRSMDLDTGDMPARSVQDVREASEDLHQDGNPTHSVKSNHEPWDDEEEGGDMVGSRYLEKVSLSTVFETDEEGEWDVQEEEKEVIQVTETSDPGTFIESQHITAKSNFPGRDPGTFIESQHIPARSNSPGRDQEAGYRRNKLEINGVDEQDPTKDPASVRRKRIQNIFMLCGNHRELAKHVRAPQKIKEETEAGKKTSDVSTVHELISKPVLMEVPIPQSQFRNSSPGLEFKNDGNCFTSNTIAWKNVPDDKTPPVFSPAKESSGENNMKQARTPSKIESLGALLQDSNGKWSDEDDTKQIEVYVKWESAKELGGKFITTIKLPAASTLAALRKLIEAQMGEENDKQAFSFLLLGDPSGTPVLKEQEATTGVQKLPICNSQLDVHLASLRPNKKAIQRTDHLPFTSLENILPLKQADGFSPKVGQVSPAILMQGMRC